MLLNKEIPPKPSRREFPINHHGPPRHQAHNKLLQRHHLGPHIRKSCIGCKFHLDKELHLVDEISEISHKATSWGKDVEAREWSYLIWEGRVGTVQSSRWDLLTNVQPIQHALNPPIRMVPAQDLQDYLLEGCSRRPGPHEATQSQWKVARSIDRCPHSSFVYWFSHYGLCVLWI